MANTTGNNLGLFAPVRATTNPGALSEADLLLARAPAGRAMVAHASAAGRGLGGLLGTALGGQSSEQAQAQEHNAALMGIVNQANELSGGDPQKRLALMMEGFMQNGMVPQALEVYRHLQEAQESQAEIASKYASADKDAAWRPIMEARLNQQIDYQSERLKQYWKQLEIMEKNANTGAANAMRSLLINDLTQNYMQAKLEQYNMEAAAKGMPLAESISDVPPAIRETMLNEFADYLGQISPEERFIRRILGPATQLLSEQLGDDSVSGPQKQGDYFNLSDLLNTGE